MLNFAATSKLPTSKYAIYYRLRTAFRSTLVSEAEKANISQALYAPIIGAFFLPWCVICQILNKLREQPVCTW